MATKSASASKGKEVPKKKPPKPNKQQSSMFDKDLSSIADKSVVDALYQHIIDAESTAEAASRHGKAMKSLRDGITAIKGLRAKEGDRIRIRDRIVPFVRRSGGGFKIPSYSKVVAGKPEPVTKG